MKKLPIGIANFKDIIEEGYYYVDKTQVIERLLKEGPASVIFTRPRRFGKTLTLNMLKCFFEDTEQLNIPSRQHLFHGLYIQASEYFKEQGRYPVIYLSFKDCRPDTWEECLENLKEVVQNEYERHAYAFEDNKGEYDGIKNDTITLTKWQSSLSNLAKHLKSYHQQKCIIIIDEYDVPLREAHINGFYNQAIKFIKNLFSRALKDNTENVKMSIISGCLRISKESMFTGWNNAVLYTITGSGYTDIFGLTDAEVQEMLKYYDMIKEYNTVREWYNGYTFNKTQIYNTWEVLNFIQAKINDSTYQPCSYWVNTIIQDVLDLNDNQVREDLEKLLQNETITKPITDYLNYGNLKKEKENLWSILLHSGYLTTVSKQLNGEYELKIPNRSIRQCFIEEINLYFKQVVEKSLAEQMDKCFIENDAQSLNYVLNLFLQSTLSYYDDLESFYHGLVVGLCGGLNHKYNIQSNKEKGDGRADLVLSSKQEFNTVIILEFKFEDNPNNLAKKAQEALKQIDDKNYGALPLLQGAKPQKFGIAFNKKQCVVVGK